MDAADCKLFRIDLVLHTAADKCNRTQKHRSRVLKMKIVARSTLLISLYTVFAFLFFIGKAFFFTNIPELFPEDIVQWRFVTGLYEFLYWLPSILAAVNCIALSWAFGKDAEKNLARFSAVQLKNYRSVLIAAGICVVLCFVCAEVFVPIVSAAEKRLKTRVENYMWYAYHAQSAIDEGNAAAAFAYAENALTLQPADENMKKLRDSAQRLSIQGKYRGGTAEHMPADIAEIESMPNSALVLFKKAQEAFDNKSFFDAHYYAWWALKLAGENSADSDAIRRLAVEAWEIISTWSGFETNEDSRIFLKKREGYAALTEGNILSAYYIFRDLYELSEFDPDIARFHRRATEALLRQYFFIDETRNIAHIENFKDVSFKLQRPDGGFDAITIDGVTDVAQTDRFVKYLRNYSCQSYNESGKLMYSVSVPYVKVIGQKAGTFGNDYAKHTGIQNPETFVPLLLMTSVDRRHYGIVGSPRYSTPDGELPMQDITRIIPMSLKDFDMVCRAASEGPMYMNLAFLFRFMPIAQRYGFSPHIFATALLQRSCRPMLFLVFFLLLAIVAWNFKLESSKLFRFSWLFSIPVFTVFLQYCIEFIRYSMNLVYYALASFTSYAQLPAAFILFFVTVVILSLRFLSLHDLPADD